MASEQVFVHFLPEKVVGIEGEITQEIVNFMRERFTALLACSWVEVHGSDDTPVRNGVYVELTTKAPMFDEVLLASMMQRASENRAWVISEGACPGSAPTVVRHVDVEGRLAVKKILQISDRHFHHNCQLSLHKQKRLRIFRCFCEALPDLARWPLERFLEHLSTPEGTAFVISYGTGRPLDRYKACPHCESSAITSVHCGNGQPVIGFLTRLSSYYSRCGACGLVFLNPAPKAADLHHLYDWYDLEFDAFSPENLSPEKLLRQNPYGSHHQHFFNYLDTLRDGKALRFLDIGGGTGRFSMAVRQRYPEAKITVRDFRIDGREYLLQHGVEATQGNILETDFEISSFDVITLWEVIEHLRFEDLAPLFGKISSWLAPGGVLALSTPNMDAPLCQAIDFWAWFAPHHLTVLRLPILESLAKASGLSLEAQFFESVLLAPGRNDFSYAAGAHASPCARAEAMILNELIGNCPNVKDYLRIKNYGSEVVAVFKK